MNQEHQDANDIITINHLLDVKALGEYGADADFSTCFESTLLHWNAGIRHSNDGTWFISVSGARMVGIRAAPPASRIGFKWREMDANGNTIRSLNYSKVPKFTGERWETISYQLKDEQFEKSLGLWMNEIANQEKFHVQLETHLEFKRGEFVNAKYVVEEDAPLLLDQNAYFLNGLNNKNRHDVELKTLESKKFLMTNKEILWKNFFSRPFLKADTNKYIVQGASSVECIDVCLYFQVSGKYKKPAIMTPTFAKEIIMVVEKWMPYLHRSPLEKSIEKHSYEAICENRENLMFVIDFLILADDNRLDSLKANCMATIIIYHFSDFNKICVDGNLELKERLARCSGFSYKSLAEEMNDAFDSTKKCKTSLKSISDHEKY